MTEAFLQYIWFHKLFLPEQLTTEGKRVEILNVGMWNKDEGADAFNAKIKIDGLLWVGNVEIHVRSSQWKEHKHDNNAAYDSVILHVVAVDDEKLMMKNGQQMPTIVLSVSDTLKSIYEQMQQKDSYIRCAEALPTVSEFHKEMLVEKMAIERMRAKAETVEHIVEMCNGDMERAFFVLLCRNFGFSVNSDAMQRLAMSFEHNILMKMGDNPLQIEALLLGQAGFLDAEAKDEYTLLLQREYKHLKTKYRLLTMAQGQFKMLRLRPYNFPTLRIVQLADLMVNKPLMYAKMMQEDNLERLRGILCCKASSYWDKHFTLSGKESKEKTKTLSESSLNILIINTVVPFLFHCAEKWDKEEYSQRALSLLEILKAEKNNVTSQFVTHGFKNKNALQSQGIIQCYREYCQKGECLRCPLHYQILKEDL